MIILIKNLMPANEKNVCSLVLCSSVFGGRFRLPPHISALRKLMFSVVSSGVPRKIKQRDYRRSKNDDKIFKFGGVVALRIRTARMCQFGFVLMEN